MNWLLFLLLSVALILIECLIGGTRLIFAYPTYALLGVGAILSLPGLLRPVSRPSTPLLLSTFLLAGYVAVRAWYSPYDYLARPDLYMTGACLIVYLLTALYFTRSRPRLAFVGVLLAFAILQTWVGYKQYTGEDGFMLFGFQRLDTGWRASGTLISGNHYAGLLETIAMFGLGLAFWSRQRLPLRFLALLIALLCYLGIGMSGSRGGYISTAFSLIVFGALSIRALAVARPGAALRPTLAISVGLLLFLGTAFYFGATNKSIRSRTDALKNPDIRVHNWAATIDHFKVQPWIGTGAGTHLIYGRLFRKPPLQSDPVHAHSDYLEMLAEYGVVGEALALLFLGAHLLGGLGHGKRIALTRLQDDLRSDALALNIGAMGAAAALTAHSVVDFNMHIPGNALLYAFVFGLLANPGRTPLPGPPRLVSLPVFARLCLPGLGIALLVATIPKYKGAKLTEEARVALRDHHYSQSIQLAKSAVAHENFNPYTWFYMGEANRMIAMKLTVPALRERFFNEALKAYKRGLQLLPQDINLLTRLAQALDGLGRHEEAEAVYHEALRWDPNLGVLHAYLASHYLLVDNEEAAKAAQAKADSFPGPSVHGRDEIGNLKAFRQEVTAPVPDEEKTVEPNAAIR